MRHAIIGAGGIGGLLAAALAHGGADVLLLVRPESLAAYDGHVRLESAVLGDYEVDVPAAPVLEHDVDVVWVTSKATQLEPSLALAPRQRVGGATVIPLLNGVDHIALLRGRYPSVVAAAIRVESERLAPGRIRQSSPMLRVDLAGAEHVAGDLEAGGIECRLRDDEVSLLWEKLAFLAPVALATTALDGTLGDVRDDPRFVRCQGEVLAVARAEGAVLDDDDLRALRQATPGSMRSSMQKDVGAGRAPELDAIAGPILRGGARHGIPVPATGELGELVRARASRSIG